MLRRREDGFSLIEMSIAMALVVVVFTISLTAVMSARRVFIATDDETTGQTDVRTAVERLGRDIRSARGVDAGATANRLEIWIDSNSDYRRVASEIVVWELTPRADGQYDVRRSANGAGTVTAETIIDQLAFCYKAVASGACLPAAAPSAPAGLSPANAKTVTIVETTMRYDARVGSGTKARDLKVVERMRNVG